MRIRRHEKRKHTGRMFREDMFYGDYWAERQLAMLGVTKYRKMEGKFSGFDYITYEGDEIVLREMKSCRLGHKTGNIAIEFKCSGRDSGISVTKADYYDYLIVETGELYDIPVSVLKDAIHRNLFHDVLSGGDNKGAMLYLFRKEVFDDYLIIKRNHTAVSSRKVKSVKRNIPVCLIAN